MVDTHSSRVYSGVMDEHLLRAATEALEKRSNTVGTWSTSELLLLKILAELEKMNNPVREITIGVPPVKGVTSSVKPEPGSPPASKRRGRPPGSKNRN